MENIKRNLTEFIGKRKDNGKWICGYYYYECGGHYIFEDNQKSNELNRNIPYEVIPETVARYTGFKDKNGNKLYLRDAVKSWIKDQFEPAGGFWWYGVIEEMHGCLVVNQVGFDYKYSTFPEDYIFLYAEAGECERVGSFYESSVLEVVMRKLNQ